MKCGVIFNPRTKNFGDDMQTYAAARFLRDPVYLDREKLNEVTQPVKAIVSGWFMDDCEQWPPAEVVNPLFLSFHGNERIINSDLKSYYDKCGPIGCRDYDTLGLFSSIGVESYFSGCLTLTLPRLEVPRTDEVIIVDMLRDSFEFEYRNFVRDNLVPKAFRNDVSFMSHLTGLASEMDPLVRMSAVERRLERYAGAKLVVTSLIHCALPCLALGTPVLFIDYGFGSGTGGRRSRFAGILDLMNVCSSISAPFDGNSRIDALARRMGVYKLTKSWIRGIPDHYFCEPLENPNTYEVLSCNMVDKVSLFLGGA